MRKIALLPDEVVNKIAAGEIIERPVSIVKELVENSLDAGATEIRIDIEHGGKQLIRVTDNGCGIASDQALLAFERHATSKIESPDDLQQIATMGFRGEALASIAAVSHVQLKTRRQEETAGVTLFLVGGKCQTNQPAAFPQGTMFESRNLFFNTPARKKFLKSDGTESAAITHMVQAFAMANPQIAFSLYHDQRQVLSSPVTSTLKERIYQIFGAELLDHLVELDEKLYHFHLTGFVSNTTALKTNKNYQYFFINKRLVKDKVLSNSVYVAYRVYAETGQYPVAFLFLDMPASMVDVNVHPAKYEVRFLQQSLVQKGIIDSIQKALGSSRPLPNFQLSANPYIPRYSAPELNLQSAAQTIGGSVEHSYDSAPGLSMPAPAPRKMPQAGEYKIIGQYDHTYVVLSDEGGLILVDQHVAHERVLYELLLRKQEAQDIHRQHLLIPLVLELNPAQLMLIEDYTDHFRNLGFDMELFGNGSVMVREIPDLLADGNYSAAIQRLFNDMEKLYRDGVLESFAEEMRKSMACQAAVKINMPLTSEKMEWLIAELLKTNTPQVCPHGRPIILRISHYEIEKNFKRI